MPEISKGIWHRQNIDPEPDIYGTAVFAQMGQNDMAMFSRKGALVLSALHLGDSIAIDFRIRENLGGTIKCIETATLPVEEIRKFGNGFVLVIFKYLRKSFELSLFEYIRHVNGRQPHKELAEVEEFIRSNEGKFKER